MNINNSKNETNINTKSLPLSVRLRGYLKAWIENDKNGIAPHAVAIQAIQKKTESDRAIDQYRNNNLQLASIRRLPYPFKYFISLNSDCDSVNMDGLLNTSKLIREKYGLPVADSIFPKWLFVRAHNAFNKEKETRKNKSDVNYLYYFVKENFEWLKEFTNGSTDCIHGWIPRMRIKIADDFSLGWQPPFCHWIENKLTETGLGVAQTIMQRLLQIPASRWNRCKKIDFIVPASWHKREAPKYLYFEASLPHTGRWFEVHIATMSGVSGTVSSASLSTCKLGFNSYLIDLNEVLQTNPKEFNDISVSFELMGGRIGKLFVKRPTLLSDVRADIEQQIECMKEFNIKLTSYTSHGGGYDIGRQSSPSTIAADNRIIAEDPGNPHYALDLFNEYGIDFYNTASNTSANKIQEIGSTTYPNILNNGQVIYDFTRYMTYNPDELALPGKASSSGIIDPSYSEAAGRQVFSAIKRMKQPGEGALIYTHLLVKAIDNKYRGEHSVEKLLNDDTHQALEELADRYYGLSENTDCSENRIWVSATSHILRYSQVFQGINGHAFYDEEANTVHIHSWFDYVLNRKVPNLKYGIRELRGLTFYVNEAHSAKLQVDGVCYDCLIRNPADETGVQSITIADISTPYILLDEYFFNGIDSRIAKHENVKVNSAEHSISLILNSEKGHFSTKLSNSKLAHYQYLSITYKKSSVLMKYRISIVCENDLVLSVAEDGCSMLQGAYVTDCWNSKEYRTVIVPFYELLKALPHKEKMIPVADIKELTIYLEGQQDDKFEVNSVKLLRDNDIPADGEYLVGGTVEVDAKIKCVVISNDNNDYSVKTIDNKYFLFSRKFAPGVYRIHAVTVDDRCLSPKSGSFLNIFTDNLNIKI